MKLLQCAVVIFIPFILAPRVVSGECTEYKIVEYEDRIEAVCVGEPLTEAQLKANREEEKRQELEAKRQKALDERRQKEAEVLDAKNKAMLINAERSKQPVTPTVPQKSNDRSRGNQTKF